MSKAIVIHDGYHYADHIIGDIHLVNPAFSACGLVIVSGGMLTWNGIFYCLTDTAHLMKATVLTRFPAELQLVDSCLADATHNMISGTIPVGSNKKYYYFKM